jgi:hypothetical protein
VDQKKNNSTQEDPNALKEKEKEAEISSLEEEMRKRRERVRLWQEARAKQSQQEEPPQLESEHQAVQSIQLTHSTVDASEQTVIVAESANINAVVGVSMDVDTEKEAKEPAVDSADSLVVDAEPEVVEKPRWTLEDDEDTDPEEDNIVPDAESSNQPNVPSLVPSLEFITDAKKEESVPHSRGSRWEDSTFRTMAAAESKGMDEEEEDPLDAFMAGLLQSGAIAEQKDLKKVDTKAVQKKAPVAVVTPHPVSQVSEEPEDLGINFHGSNTITLDEIMNNKKGWESDFGESTNASPYTSQAMETEDNEREETEEEREAREEKERQEFIEAFRKARAEEEQMRERLLRLEEEQQSKAKSKEDLGRVFGSEGDVADEYEIEQRKRSALDLLEEAKKGKVLKEVDHNKINYIPFRKNLYIVPRVLAKLTEDQVSEKRDQLQVKVRGRGCPVQSIPGNNAAFPIASCSVSTITS